MNKIELALKKGISYLAKNQKQDGSFESLTAEKMDFAKAKKVNSIFPSCLILSCLNNLPWTQEIKAKTISFLLTQKSTHWSFNYWKRKSKESTKTPYPDDLDDTFCALAAIHRYNREIINGNVLANIVSLLSLTEEKVGGPYRTWLAAPTADSSWKDVDLAVNCNIAYFLFLEDIRLKNIDNLINKAIKEQQLNSPYYYSNLPIIYFLSRFYQGNKKKELCQILLSQRNPKGHWSGPLQTALAVSALLNLDASINLAPAISYLLSCQNPDGSWAAAPFVVELIHKEKNYYSGSAALSTAFCLEAIYQQKKLLLSKSFSPKKLRPTRKKERIHQQILQDFQKEFSGFRLPIKKPLEQELATLLKNDSQQQITLLPYYFHQALGEKGEKIPSSFLVQLGKSNLYGWLAYTIYDDFLDNEGLAQKLPLANICLRRLTQTYSQLFSPTTGFSKLFSQIMDQLEEANAWETMQARLKSSPSLITIPKNLPSYGDYLKLAQRSLGHALGPLAILFFLGLKENSNKIKNSLEFFRHYIIARQLNDDAHDWEKDLRMGILTPVVVRILKRYKKNYRKNSLRLPQQIAKLQKIFWYHVIIDVCQDILENISQAREYLQKMSFLENPQLLEILLQKEEKIAQKTLEEQKNICQFISKYQ